MITNQVCFVYVLYTLQWKLMVATFCEMDTSVKDRVYSCCKEQGSAQLKCFQEDAPNASYLPTEELPVSPIPVESSFSFSPDTCLSNAPLRCTEAVPCIMNLLISGDVKFFYCFFSEYLGLETVLIFFVVT